MRDVRKGCIDLADVCESDIHAQERLRALWVLIGAVARSVNIPCLEVIKMLENAERSIQKGS